MVFKKSYLALASAIAIGIAASAEAAVVYTANIEGGSRFNNGVPTTITFDDVPIPASRLNAGAATAIDITKITIGIRQAAADPGTVVNFFAFNPDADGLPVPAGPLSSLGSFTVSANGGAGFRTVLATVGDGVGVLSRVGVNYSFLTPPGTFGTIMVGATLSTTTTNIGIRNATGPDANVNSQFGLLRTTVNPPDPTVDGYGYSFGAGTTTAQFYIIVEGNAVPEPVSLGALAMGGMIFAHRRRA